MKNIKYLKDFTKEDYQKLFNENESFKELAYNTAIENADFWVGEYLSAFKDSFSDYSIGVNNHNYIEIKDYQTFIQDFYNFMVSYSCSDEQENQYKKALVSLNRYENEEDEEKTYSLYESFEEEADKLKGLLLESWVSEYEYWDHNDDELLNFIIEDIEANEYMQEYYIKNNDFTKLYILIPEHEEVYKYNY